MIAPLSQRAAPSGGFTAGPARAVDNSLRSPRSGLHKNTAETSRDQAWSRDQELCVLFRLLCSVARWVESREVVAAVSPESFTAAMSHLGLHLSQSDVRTMFNHAEEGELNEGVQRDGLLEVEEFIRETSDAQRDIHDNDHPRSAQQLWRVVYTRLKLVDDARRMRQTVLDLRGLFGIAAPSVGTRTLSNQANVQANLEVAAQLVLDTVQGRNIYHKLDRESRQMYLQLHKLRHVFGAVVWVQLFMGWVEDQSHDTHEWMPSLQVSGANFWVIPAVELCLLPVHCYHCYLRIAVSVRWQNDMWLMFKCFAILGIMCDALHELALGRNTMPLSRLLRPYLLLEFYSEARKLHMQCVRALRSLKELMLLASIFILFFLLAGLMMYPTPGGVTKESVTGQGHVRGTSQGGAVFTDVWQRLCQMVPPPFNPNRYCLNFAFNIRRLPSY